MTSQPQPTTARPEHRRAPHPTSRLVAEVGEILATARADPADSFVLHAPLELVARSALLPFVQPPAGEPTRGGSSARLATSSRGLGPPVRQPAAGPTSGPSSRCHDPPRSRRSTAGSSTTSTSVARWLGRPRRATELQSIARRRCGVDRLAAAAHAPIFLYQLPRVAPRGEVTGELLRGLARELGRAPEWRLHWIDDARERRAATTSASGAEVFDALAATPARDAADPGATPFIYPLMSRVDEPGIADGIAAR